MTFARLTGQPISEAMAMHPRDLATWLAQAEGPGDRLEEAMAEHAARRRG